MSRERWGTFSVADHLRPRAFVAEALLFDRLVIPYPPTPEERQRWTAQKWQPDLLERKLETLGEKMAIRVPWDQDAQNRYKSRFDASLDVNFDGALIMGEQVQADPFYWTRKILAQDFRPRLPKGVSKVWALAAYPAFDAYRGEARQATGEEMNEALVVLLTNRILVPECSGESDDEMLERAVRLADREDFKEKRAKLHRWQEDVVEQQIPPDKAVEEMEEDLKQYNAIVERAVRDVYCRYAFMAIPVAISLATAGLGTPLVMAGAAGLASVATFAKFERKPKIDAGDCDAAALIHDVQDYFQPTWKDKWHLSEASGES